MLLLDNGFPLHSHPTHLRGPCFPIKKEEEEERKKQVTEEVKGRLWGSFLHLLLTEASLYAPICAVPYPAALLYTNFLQT